MFILCVFCVLFLPLSGLNQEIFYAKLSQPTPTWMLDQIEEDLAPFTKELSRKFLDELFQRDDLWLVRVYVAKGKIKIRKSRGAARHSTPDQIIPHLLVLNKLVPLPDMDFIFTVEDGLMSISPDIVFNTPEAIEARRFNDDELIGPIFCITQYDNKNGVIAIPDMYALKGFEPGRSLVLEGNCIYPWESKINTIFYRGADVGIIDLNEWLAQPRLKLVSLSCTYPDLIDAKITTLYSSWHKNFALEKGYMGNYISLRDHPQYKYLISVDAICAATPRFPLLLHSNSVVFKDMGKSHLWFIKALRPYEHFVPVKEDLSDLFTQLDWAKNHDDECKKISENARRLAADVLTHEAVYLYLYRLFEAYSKKQRYQYHLN